MICTSCYLYGGIVIPTILNSSLLYGPITLTFIVNAFIIFITFAYVSVYKPSASKIELYK